MVYTTAKGIHKKLKNKVLNLSAAIVLMTASLSGVAPILTQTAFAVSPSDLYVSQGGGGDCSSLAQACGSINQAINDAIAGTVVHVAAGTYTENVNVNKAVSVEGAGSATTKIVATNGNSTPLTFGTSGATVSGFTITHDYTPAELSAWNFNNNGVAFGQLTTGNTLENCVVSLSRNGIYINRSQNNVIGNTITDNRTGINATNTINGTQITGNTISNNWTLGFVYYDQGYSTDFDTVTMTGNSFDNNWYTQVEVKSAAGSIGTLDVTNNSFSDSPVTYATSSDASWNEPGFAAQKPVELGGSATPPTDNYYPTLRIFSSGSVVLKHTAKTLRVGSTEPYHTIQSAINDASDDDTISVDAGTYAENVTVNKQLTLDGANAGVSPNTGTRGNESTIDGSVSVAASNVKIDGFTVDPGSGSSIAMQGNYSGETVINNVISDNGYAVNFNTGNTTISNNKVTYGASYSSGVEANSNPAGGLTFSGNVFNGDGSNSPADITVIGASSPQTSGVTVSGNQSTSGTTLAALFNTKTASVTGNTVSGANASVIYVGGNDSGVTVTGNTITGSTTAVNVANDFGDGINSGVTVNGNDLGDDTNGVKVSSNAYAAGSTVDATNNWWGDVSGPTDKVSGDGSVTETNPNGSGSAAVGAVKYLPWCINSGCTEYNNQVAPTLLSPANNSYLTNAGTLDWSDVPGAVGYEYDSSHSSSTDANGKLSDPIYDNSGLTASQIDASGTAEGTYYWQVRAKFGDGSYSPWASPWKLTVDKTKPTAPNITTPTAGQYFDSTPIVDSWTAASDSLSGVDHYQIAYLYDDQHAFSGSTCSGLKINGQTVSGCRDVNGTSRNHVPGTNEQGGVTIWVRAIDKAGNVGDWSNSVHYYYDLTSLSAPSLISPSNNAILNGASLTNSWSSVSDATKYEYESFNSSNTSGTPRYDQTYSATSKTATNVANGTVFYWRVRAIDQYGKTGPWSNLWKVTVDNDAPVAKITGPNGTYVSGTVTISGTVTDTHPDHYYLVVKNSSGHVVAGPGTVHAASVSDYNWNTTGLPDGTYTIDLEARDAAGNKDSGSTATKTVVVDNTGPDTPAASPAGGTYTGTQLVSLLSNDSGSGLASIYYTTDGTTPSSTNGVRLGGAFSVSSSQTVKAVAYDDLGNESGVMDETYVINASSPGGSLGTGPNSHIFTATFVQGGQGQGGLGGGGAGGAGAAGTGGTGGNVLGVSTTTPNTTNTTGSGNSDNGKGNVGVEGASTGKDTKKSSAFLGLGWWWLLVLLLAALLVYGLTRGANSTEKNNP